MILFGYQLFASMCYSSFVTSLSIFTGLACLFIKLKSFLNRQIMAADRQEYTTNGTRCFCLAPGSTYAPVVQRSLFQNMTLLRDALPLPVLLLTCR